MEMMAKVLHQNQELLECLTLLQTNFPAPLDVSMRVDPDASAVVSKFTGLEGDIVANEWITEFIQRQSVHRTMFLRQIVSTDCFIEILLHQQLRLAPFL